MSSRYGPSVDRDREARLRRQGEKPALELVSFARRSTANREESAQILLGAYEVLETRTSMFRSSGHPWPVPPEDAPPLLDDPN